MHVDIYRTWNDDIFLIIERGTEISELPEEIRAFMGSETPWKTQNIHPDMHLAGMDSGTVYRDIRAKKYCLIRTTTEGTERVRE